MLDPACMCGSGVTYALAAIFSIGQRKQLLPFASQMWTDAAQLLNSRSAASSVVARKYATKLVQRIGLTFLPATAAAWRYQQTSVSINHSLSSINPNKPAAEAPLLSSNHPARASDGADTAAQPAGVTQHHQSTGAHGVASDESARPALQPSPLVNTSPITSPTPKAYMLASDRPHTGATNAVQGSQVEDAAKCQPDSPEHAALNETAVNRQNPGAAAAAAADASHESGADEDASSADGEYADDIPEEIEEVSLTVFCCGVQPQLIRGV